MGHLLHLLAAVALLVWGTYLLRTGVLRVFGANLRTLDDEVGRLYSSIKHCLTKISRDEPAAHRPDQRHAAHQLPDLFGEQDVTQRPVEQRGVGMVSQSCALFPQMSVAANIGYGLRIRGVGADVGQGVLLLRPEDLQVGAAQTGWGTARVVQRSFLGERVQLRVQLAGLAVSQRRRGRHFRRHSAPDGQPQGERMSSAATTTFIVQITAPHIREPGRLAYGCINTAPSTCALAAPSPALV